MSSIQLGHPPPLPPSHHGYAATEHTQHSQSSHPPHPHHLQQKHQSTYPPPLQPYYNTPHQQQQPQSSSSSHMASYSQQPHHGLPPLAANPMSVGASSIPQKRSASHLGIHSGSVEPPPKKMGKWTPEEDRLAIELRRKGMKWEDISKQLPGRSAISCRLRYQNYSEKRPEWDEERKNKLARLYNRFKKEMWDMIAKEMSLPWRAVESMHWQMGAEEMAQRANVAVFQSHVPAMTSVKPALSSASTTGTTRRLSPKSPTQTGAVSDHSSVGGGSVQGGAGGRGSGGGEGGVSLSNPSTEPLSASSHADPITRGRRVETGREGDGQPVWDRKRNDSKVMDKIEGEEKGEEADHYRRSMSEERDSPGGVPLEMVPVDREYEREERGKVHETHKTYAGESWEKEKEEISISDQARSRSPTSVLSGGAVHHPSISSTTNIKHDRD